VDFGQVLFAVLGIVVFAVIAGAVGQIMEGELLAGLGFLVLGFLLMAVYFGGTAAFGVDALPFDPSRLWGLFALDGSALQFPHSDALAGEASTDRSRDTAWQNTALRVGVA
jgi:hypothetical protein